MSISRFEVCLSYLPLWQHSEHGTMMLIIFGMTTTDDHRNMGISGSGSKAQHEGDTETMRVVGACWEDWIIGVAPTVPWSSKCKFQKHKGS